MGKFLLKDGFLDKLKSWSKSKPTKVIWGTCAGLILLADHIENEKDGGQLKVIQKNNPHCIN